VSLGEKEIAREIDLRKKQVVKEKRKMDIFLEQHKRQI
jgi:hypothetical protein